MSILTHPSLSEQLAKFDDEFGDELDTCNPNAYDLLHEIISSGDLQQFEDFIWYFADELDACHPEAFDKIYELATQYDLPI